MILRYALILGLLLSTTGCHALIAASVVGGMANGIQFAKDFLDLDTSWHNFLGQKEKPIWICAPQPDGGFVCTEK